MNVRSSTYLPILALLYASTFWGVLWLPARELESLGLSGPWQLLTSYSAALILLMLIKGLALNETKGHFKETVILVLAAGWTNVAFLLAVLDGEVVRVMILFYLSPLWSVLLGRWLLGEALRWTTGLSLLLGLAGMGVMLWEGDILSSTLNQSDIYAVTAGFTFSLTNVMTRRMSQLSTVCKTQLGWLGGILVAFVLIYWQGISFPMVSSLAWSSAVLLGLAGFFFSTLAVVYGVSHMPVQRSAVIMLFEIIVGAASAWLWANEMIDLREWLGGILIISGGLVAVYYGQESTSKHVKS